MTIQPNRSIRYRLRTGWRWVVIVALFCNLIVGALTTPFSLHAQDGATPTPAATSEYTVKVGDTWIGLAQQFGVTTRALREANPEEAAYYPILRLGRTLVIPGPGEAAPTPPPTNTPALEATATLEAPPTPESTLAPTPTSSAAGYQEYIVQPGDYWGRIADQFGISMRELMAANPRSIRYGDILYRGERLRIPAPAHPAIMPVSEAARDVATTPVAEPTATATLTATPASETTATVTATSTVTATDEVTMTDEVTATTPITGAETLTLTAPVTATESISPSAAASIPEGCPADFADYPEALGAVLNAEDGGLAGLAALLELCGATVENGLQSGDWNGDGLDDLVLIYANPLLVITTPQTDLIIFNGSESGFTESYRAKAAGEVTLLATGDINSDDQPDVAWLDHNCGASTCFDTVEVVSWNGEQWRDWTTDVITMAYAEVSLADAAPEGQGEEILLEGGVYGSVGAGPQRSRSETWASIAGAPYTLLERTYSASNCLYHVVMDANEALLRGTEDDFAQAEELYTKAATDQKLEKCWVRDNELDELRSFSLFRLALTAAYQGQPSVAADVISSLSATYEGSIYDELGQTWLSAYREGNDIGTACSAANQFATDNAEAWEILADYGYANPTFSAGEVCPVLDLETLSIAGEEVDSDAALTETTSLTGTALITESAPLTGTAPLSGTSSSASAQLPTCPVDLSAYPGLLPEVLVTAAGDESLIEGWLRGCDAMADDRGGFQLLDANGDGVQDAIFWPTVISDLGFGPDGTQGDVLILHGTVADGYEVVADQEIYGQPQLLATEDLNDDGVLDLAWQVVGCSTFCVLEVQIVSWDGEGYAPIIEPGATIAEGVAAFESVVEGDPGAGQQLVLQGGVSGTQEGGLAVPHAEVWQSVGGAPFQRIRWTYDRTVENNDCAGLRLIEGDVALEAADVLGYQPAIEIFTATMDPALKACSIFGMRPAEELVLLQGLTSFRLIEAQALSGDLEAARATLAAFRQGQPDSLYAEAALQWLEVYAASQDAAAACETVLPIFAENPALWQITDHFGYNHPALAAEQVCYAP